MFLHDQETNASPFMLKRIFLLLFLLLPYHYTAYAQSAQKVDITLTGLNEEMQKNVLAGLSLAKQSKSQHLTDFIVKRLGQKADEEIKKALEPFGYYNPKIKIDLHKQENTWLVMLDVDPGDPVVVSDVEIELSGPGSSEKLLTEALENFPLHEGDILNHQRRPLIFAH